jgi:hypothetical protein
VNPLLEILIQLEMGNIFGYLRDYCTYIKIAKTSFENVLKLKYLATVVIDQNLVHEEIVCHLLHADFFLGLFFDHQN